MKKILAICFLIVSAFAFGQTKIKVSRKTIISKESIDSARIGKYLDKAKCLSDSCWDVIYRDLRVEQVNYFVDQWNNAVYLGEKKLKPDYCIELYLKDGTKKVIKISRSLSEKNNYQFTTEDKRFLKDLWKNAVKE